MKQTGVGKIRGKTNLVSKLKKKTTSPLKSSHNFYHLKFVFKLKAMHGEFNPLTPRSNL